jgi:CheY-like chemotaxis protein
MRVLLVDDEKDLVAALSMRLRASGVEVLSAADGLEGLSAAAAFEPDLIFLDVSMPRMDGWELCRCLHENPLLSATPVVLMTGQPFDELRKEAEAARALRTLLKPFNEREIAEALELVQRKTS